MHIYSAEWYSLSGISLMAAFRSLSPALCAHAHSLSLTRSLCRCWRHIAQLCMFISFQFVYSAVVWSLTCYCCCCCLPFVFVVAECLCKLFLVGSGSWGLITDWHVVRLQPVPFVVCSCLASRALPPPVLCLVFYLLAARTRKQTNTRTPRHHLILWVACVFCGCCCCCLFGGSSI